jgi:hypothetical protein
MRDKYLMIPFDDWPSAFVEWLDKITEHNKYPSVIEHHRGQVSLVVVKKPVSSHHDLKGVKWGRLVTDALGSFLEVRYRPALDRVDGEDVIIVV